MGHPPQVWPSPDVTLVVEIRSIRGKSISTQRGMSRPYCGKYPYGADRACLLGLVQIDRQEKQLSSWGQKHMLI